MNTNSVSKPSASKLQPMSQTRSTVCGLCQGIGEKGHSRSKTADIYDPSGDSIEPPVYVYLHYPDPVLLRSSYEQYGCQTCRLILSCIQHESTGSAGTHGEQAQETRDSLTSFDIERDTYEAASILRVNAPFIRDECLRMSGCGSGRVVLCIKCPFYPIDAAPRADTNTSYNALDVEVYIFNGTTRARRMSRRIQVICSPG